MPIHTSQQATDTDSVAIERFAMAAAAHGDVTTDEGVLTERGRDHWGVGGVSGLLLRPHGRDDIAPIMRLASEHNVAIVPRGGGSNCSGGMMLTAGRVLLDLSGLDEILDIDAENRRARVEPGITDGFKGNREELLSKFRRSLLRLSVVSSC